MCYLLASRDNAISCNSGGSHNNPGRAIMDHRRAVEAMSLAEIKGCLRERNGAVITIQPALINRGYDGGLGLREELGGSPGDNREVPEREV